MSNFWQISRRNLARNKKRNLATGAAIALGFAALLVLGGYYNWIGNILRVFTIYPSRLGHIVIFQHDGIEKHLIKPHKYSLSAQDLAFIKQTVAGLDDIEMHGPLIVGTGLIGNGCRSFPFIGVGIDPILENKLRYHPESKKWLGYLIKYKKGHDLDAYPPDVGAIIVARGLARYLHKDIVYDEFLQSGRKVMLSNCAAKDVNDKFSQDSNVQLAAGAWNGMFSAVDGEIAAITITGQIETDTSFLVASIDHLRKLYDTEGATSYSIWLDNPNPIKIHQTIEALQNTFQQAGKSYDVYRWDDEKLSPYYTGSIRFVVTLVIFIACVSLAVIIFSILNSATITIIERSQEIGMMRSLGFTKNDIRKLFVLEGALLTVFAVIVGGVIAAIGMTAVNNAEIPYNPPGISVTLWLRLIPSPAIVSLAIIVIFVLSIIATLLAVWSLSGRNIANLLVRSNR